MVCFHVVNFDFTPLLWLREGYTQPSGCMELCAEDWARGLIERWGQEVRKEKGSLHRGVSFHIFLNKPRYFGKFSWMSGEKVCSEVLQLRHATETVTTTKKPGLVSGKQKHK